MITVYTWLATAVTKALRFAGLRLVRPGYVGRHRLERLAMPAGSPSEATEAARKAVLKESTQETPVADIDSKVGRYRYKAGVGRYAHLRIEELDAQADRARALVDRHPWSTPALLDEWTLEHESVSAT
jgi:hypothetical protein